MKFTLILSLTVAVAFFLFQTWTHVLMVFWLKLCKISKYSNTSFTKYSKMRDLQHEITQTHKKIIKFAFTKIQRKNTEINRFFCMNMCACMELSGARLDVVISFCTHEKRVKNTHTHPMEENALSASLLCLYCFVVESKLLSILLFSIHASQRTTHLSKPMAYVSSRRCCYCYTLFGVYTQHRQYEYISVWACVCTLVCTMPPMRDVNVLVWLVQFSFQLFTPPLEHSLHVCAVWSNIQTMYVWLWSQDMKCKTIRLHK